MISVFRFTLLSNALIILLGSGNNLAAQTPDSIPNQGILESVFRLSDRRDTLLLLDHQFIIPSSEVVFFDSIQLTRIINYSIDYRKGSISLYDLQDIPLRIDSIPNKVVVRYQALPFRFRDKYKHREPVIRSDTTRKWITSKEFARPFYIDDLFKSDLQANGSLLRGITVGSNRDLTLNSGFRLQMSGNLSEDIFLTAALTDENSPIQPEGVTQSLREFDKVFIEARGSRFTATLGDFHLNITGGEFGTFTRKLQGAKGVYSYSVAGSEGDIMVAAANTRGKYTSNEFLGIDGVLGPYQLFGESGERSIIVVAGTERVYVNGIQLVRGENADYTIDYANAEIMFMSRRMITNSSRIVVDFEYNDRQYSRNLYSAKMTSNLFSEDIRMDILFAQERDDKETTLDLSLTEADREILRNAGNDRNSARKSGAEYAGPGKGQYILLDSVVRRPDGTDTLLHIFRFDPGDTANAVYIVNFSYTGDGKGNYRKISSGRYEFAGLQGGNYDPVRFLPMPQSHTIIDFNLGADLGSDLSIDGEYTTSIIDRNIFSMIGDDENSGHAFKGVVHYNPKAIKVGGWNLGSLDILFRERFTGNRFASLGRINDVEFRRIWNFEDTTLADEKISELTFSYMPAEALKVGGNYGSLRRGDSFRSERYGGTGLFRTANMPGVEYVLERIKTENFIATENADWLRQRGRVDYSFSIFVPRVSAFFEDLKKRDWNADTLSYGSYRYREIVPGISVGDVGTILFTGEVGFRSDDSLASGRLQSASRTVSHQYNLQFLQWKPFSSTFDLIVSDRNFTDVFSGRGNKNLQSTLIRSQTRFNPLEKGIESDWFYEVTTGRTSVYDRIFQRVPRGAGTHVYIGDINGNRVVDYPDFEQSRFEGDFILVSVPTGEFIPSIDLKASTRLRINFSTIVDTASSLGRLISSLSAETYGRVEEQTTEPDRSKIYLLDFNHFLSDENTLIGNNLITQDFYIRENDPVWSLRFRYTQKRGLTRYALAKERLYYREQAARIRWELVEGIVNQTDFYIRRDMQASSEYSPRSRSIISHELSTDWSYRPEQELEIGMKFSIKGARNFDTVRMYNNDQAVRITYSFTGRGQISGEFTREEIVLSTVSGLLPYELTDGKSVGKTWLWRLNGEYKLSKLLQLSTQYDGRIENGRSPVHTARMELRAFF